MHDPLQHAHAQKRYLRGHFLQADQAAGAEDSAVQARRQALSSRVALTTRALLAGRDRIGIYYPLAREVDTLPLARLLWDDGKALFLPQVRGRKQTAQMVFVPYHPTTSLVARAGGMMEPKPELLPQPASEPGPGPGAGQQPATDRPLLLDALVVPGVAFDAAGRRLGQGWGCYDRLLADFAGLVVGLAYGHQMCARLPDEPHDRRMHVVVTPHAVFWGQNG